MKRMFLSLVVLATLPVLAEASWHPGALRERFQARHHSGSCGAATTATTKQPAKTTTTTKTVGTAAVTLGSGCANGSCSASTRSGLFGRFLGR